MLDFNVRGMTCGGCARGVTSAIHRVDANAVVTIDLPGKAVSIDSTVAAVRLKQAIEAAGFPVTE